MGLEAQGLQWLDRPEGGLDDRNFCLSIHEEMLWGQSGSCCCKH